jgi:hypothetical protein
MNLRPPTAVALATATLLVSGGIAFAAVQSVDTHPEPEVVVPASVEVSASAHRHRGADDPAAHDAKDDHGGDRDGDRRSRDGDDDRHGDRHGRDGDGDD